MGLEHLDGLRRDPIRLGDVRHQRAAVPEVPNDRERIPVGVGNGGPEDHDIAQDRRLIRQRDDRREVLTDPDRDDRLVLPVAHGNCAVGIQAELLFRTVRVPEQRPVVSSRRIPLGRPVRADGVPVPRRVPVQVAVRPVVEVPVHLDRIAFGIRDPDFERDDRLRGDHAEVGHGVGDRDDLVDLVSDSEVGVEDGIEPRRIVQLRVERGV